MVNKTLIYEVIASCSSQKNKWENVLRKLINTDFAYGIDLDTLTLFITCVA
jgi:hypothetical protein